MIDKFLQNKTILITGGTGSLGRAIINKLKNYCETHNLKLVVFSRDEGKQAIYFGDKPYVKRFIGDVRDISSLNNTFKKFKPNYVIHTAALKRIDDMEYFPEECLKTNVQGTINVANACIDNNVEKCILVSTDKACLPINVYGASKFTAERLFCNFDHESESTVFSSVRYGNVICSRGSFIPIWSSLIENDKTINVTSLECSRFLFTLNDAVNTVISSLVNSLGGEVFVPMFDSFDMLTTIKSLEKINNKNITYNVIGMRPGEKFHEDMLAKTELDFTYESKFLEGFYTEHCNKLLCILPQYSNKHHIEIGNLTKYIGREFNSSLFLNKDIDYLSSLIREGIKYAN